MRITRVLFLGALSAVLAAAVPGAAKTYKVQKGDTLYELSLKFHVKVSELKRANGLRSDALRPGAKLKIPVKGGSEKVAVSGKVRCLGQVVDVAETSKLAVYKIDSRKRAASRAF